ncbi:MAG: DUF3108 domain-containing protein [Bacteroidetes bacterium]|nr:DUF3108 domain-containing protein [Bacteroidota bacterium]
MTNTFKVLFFVPFIIYLSVIRNAPEKKLYEVNFTSNKHLEVGEELTYVVSYTFIKLGEIKIIVKNKKVVDGRNYYSTIAYMDSYSGIPFVDLHMIYESTLNPEYYSEFFRGIVKKEDYTTFTDYTFNYGKSLIRIKKGKIQPYQLWTDSTTSAKEEYQDGLSILYFARMFSGSGKSINVPCFVNEKKEYTLINSYTQNTGISIDAVDYDISCVKIDGKMNFISVFGLTGYFEGWFSDDAAAVPIVAKLHVIIGSVKVELKSWKREGWAPPKFKKN